MKLAVRSKLDQARLLSIGGPKRQVILTFVNKARLDFAATWAAYMRRLGLTNWMVGATDATALRALLETGVPCFDLHTSLPEGEWAWGSANFHSLGPTKVKLVEQVLRWGLELVLTDVDALVLREPFEYMDRYPGASFLTTSDHLSNTTADDGLEVRADSAYNIGYLFFRPSALPLVDAWLAKVLSDPTGSWDQGVFNDLAKSGIEGAAY
ncbi:glycosyltransferase family 77 protein [Chrysochromulina tobinii]|uniref:Glycosyltransferase family 77 protein n=1 Tax=Chrysochromulina tobinii TaxID=1460289 RepID=A0A0M0JB36_9EUKA|nr:glycosyltransferase family 77 protein [Chrysochromulina tobinii]|eukprot:KOO23428.1 glycosyltransferase family 77 protein [Chrysochromulina sp. CCMP291]